MRCSVFYGNYNESLETRDFGAQEDLAICEFSKLVQGQGFDCCYVVRDVEGDAKLLAMFDRDGRYSGNVPKDES
jgi:hypothetical protein